MLLLSLPRYEWNNGMISWWLVRPSFPGDGWSAPGCAVYPTQCTAYIHEESNLGSSSRTHIPQIFIFSNKRARGYLARALKSLSFSQLKIAGLTLGSNTHLFKLALYFFNQRRNAYPVISGYGGSPWESFYVLADHVRQDFVVGISSHHCHAFLETVKQLLRRNRMESHIQGNCINDYPTVTPHGCLPTGSL